jgi:redox-sensing transcriptional repressor
MSIQSKVPQATIRRLSLYLRCLSTLESREISLASSQLLADLLHFNPAQVRKDLSYFGEFGKRGVGYSIPKLRESIIKILGLKQQRNVAIIGAGGRLGQALSLYKGFEKRNFKIVALFDIDPTIVGQMMAGVGKVHQVHHLPLISRQLNIDMVILTVPAESANDAFKLVRESQVRAVLNFAPVKLPSTDQIVVHNVDVTTELESLSYHLNSQDLSEAAASLGKDDDSENSG